MSPASALRFASSQGFLPLSLTWLGYRPCLPNVNFRDLCTPAWGLWCPPWRAIEWAALGDVQEPLTACPGSSGHMTVFPFSSSCILRTTHSLTKSSGHVTKAPISSSYILSSALSQQSSTPQQPEWRLKWCPPWRAID
ncbi:hypothetical protein RRG08_006998 [Elysia crispata]|uniref:Uncharacterized protein n=1 Tax=Elysia crispata TaxID=231223 RepID=A0AAE1AYW0_9GAST|nr:hypothetical protein RRG08_006998 [Elysia crispata]